MVGTNCGVSVSVPDAGWRACRRHPNNCCGVSPCRRATSETTAPATSVSSTMPGFVVIREPATSARLGTILVLVCVRERVGLQKGPQALRKVPRLVRQIERRHQRGFAEPDRPDHQIEDILCRQVVRLKALPIIKADCMG